VQTTYLKNDLYPEYKELLYFNNKKKKAKMEFSLVAHTYNSSLLGGRDWEGCGLKPVWAKN
jgi:hypothetical protein